MQDEHAALFQHAQALEQERLTVRAHDVMVDVVADDGVEALIGKWKVIGVAMDEGAAVANALGRGVLLADHLTVVIHGAPVVKAGDLRAGPRQRRADGQRAGAAADLENVSLPAEGKAAQDGLMHALHHAAFAEGILAADPRHPAEQSKQEDKGRGRYDAEDSAPECGE